MPDANNNHSGEEAPAADARISFDAGRQYWEGIDADVNGMLGGFPAVSRIDLQGSRNFLAKFGVGAKPGQRVLRSALEGGAGIGRITTGLLLDVVEQVDVIEPVSKFTDALRGRPGIRDIFNVGLQDWEPSSSSGGEEDDDEGDEGDEDGGSGSRRLYDLIWIQWCAGHLTDAQLVLYLQRCKAVLRPEDGLIVVKENLSTHGADEFDEVDSSVTRQDSKFLSIFNEAGLRVIRSEIQRGFPARLFPVKMYALRPQ